MKTPHRLLHDVLTAEEWKEFLAEFRRSGSGSTDMFHYCKLAHEALHQAFDWRFSVKGWDYWSSIYDRIQHDDFKGLCISFSDAAVMKRNEGL